MNIAPFDVTGILNNGYFAAVDFFDRIDFERMEPPAYLCVITASGRPLWPGPDFISGAVSESRRP
jgi:hypothetical protein